MVDIIDENNKYLERFFILNIIFILFFIFQGVSFINYLIKFLFSAASISVLYAFVLAFKFSLNGDCKIKLVYFNKGECFFPACEAFADKNLEDHKIDKEVLVKKYGEFPVDGFEQNKLWYLIFQKNKGVNKIKTAHRDFLLLRDCNALSLLFVLFFILVITLKLLNIFNISTINCILLGVIFILEFVLFNWSARIAGKRFIKLVLSEESHSNHN